MSDPGRPRSLTDVIGDLIQSQDDAGDSGDTALYDAVFVVEQANTTDAVTTTEHAPQFVTQEQGVESGAVSRRAQFGEYFAGILAALISEATTNAHTNPGYNASDALWTASGGTATRQTTILPTGFTAAEHLVPGGSDRTWTQTLTLTAATYAIQCLARRSDGAAVTAADVVLWGQGGALATTFTSMATTLGAGWYLCTATYVAAASASTHGVQPKAGADVYVTGHQIEQKAYSTAYADGSLGTGYAWTGTENASTSTRTLASEQLSTTAASAAAGSVIVLCNPGNASTYAAARVLFDWGGAPGNERIECLIDASARPSIVSRHSSSSDTATAAALAFVAGAALALYFDWSTAANAIHAGTLAGTLGATTRATGTPVPVNASAYIGTAYDGTTPLNGSVTAVYVFTRPLTAPERVLFAALTTLATWNQIAAVMANLWYGDTTKADAYTGKAATYG